MKYVAIKDIVHSVSQTHKFEKDHLKAVNTSDVFGGELFDVPYSETALLKGQFKKTIRFNDILFSEIRPANRRFARVNIKETEDYVVSTKLMVLRKYNENIDLDYFYYCLTNQLFLEILQRRAENRIGSFPQITFDLLGEYRFPMPTLVEQKRIASVIANIDSKINVNREINRNLEAMARQLYDYWFVQFDFPDENGKPYKSSGGKMVWNDKLKQLIPEGWTHITIERYANIQNGATPSTSNELNYGGDIVWITPKDLSDQSQKFTFKGERSITNAGYKSCSTTLLPKGTVLMSSRAPIGLLSIAAVDLCTNQGFKSLVPKNESEQRFLYYLVDQYLPFIKQMGSGTTFSEVSKDELAKLKVPDVPSDLIEKWDNEAKSLFDRQEIILKEIDTLTKQQNELLPLLMNGQVSVMPSEVNCDLSHD